MRKSLHRPLLIVLAVALYLPSLPTPGFIFDDYALFDFIRDIAAGDFAKIIFSENNRYFRPVVHLSFLSDYYLWDLQPALMRLTNIVIHAINTLLVYALARSVLGHETRTNRNSALLVSAVFAAHPLHSEAINWISGRTDPLACMFALSGVLLYCKSDNGRKTFLVWGSALLIFIGCLAKEVAFFVLPALLFYLLLRRDAPGTSYGIKTRLKAGVPYLSMLATYLAARSYCIRGLDQGISKVATVQTVSQQIVTANETDTLFRALGFYAKKLLFPAPLNFAIDRVPEDYFYLGILVLALCIGVCFRRDTLTGLTVLTLSTISPALVNAIYRIAWTPYAERYLYLPTAFFLLAIACYLGYSRLPRHYLTIFLLLMFVFYIPQTLHRNMLWAKPLKLLEDTVLKTPDNHILLNNYAITLAAYGDYDQAREQLYSSIAKNPGSNIAKISLVKISLLLNDARRARSELEVFYRKGLHPDLAVLELMTEVNEELLASGAGEADHVRADQIDVYTQRYDMDGDVNHLLSAAQLAILNHDGELTGKLLARVRKAASLTEAQQAEVRRLSTAPGIDQADREKP